MQLLGIAPSLEKILDVYNKFFNSMETSIQCMEKDTTDADMTFSAIDIQHKLSFSMTQSSFAALSTDLPLSLLLSVT